MSSPQSLTPVIALIALLALTVGVMRKWDNVPLMSQQCPIENLTRSKNRPKRPIIEPILSL